MAPKARKRVTEKMEDPDAGAKEQKSKSTKEINGEDATDKPRVDENVTTKQIKDNAKHGSALDAAKGEALDAAKGEANAISLRLQNLNNIVKLIFKSIVYIFLGLLALQLVLQNTFRDVNLLGVLDISRMFQQGYWGMQDEKVSYQRMLHPSNIEVNGRKLVPKRMKHTTRNPGSVQVYVVDDFLNETEVQGFGYVHATLRNRFSEDPIFCFSGVKELKTFLQHLGHGHKKVSEEDFTEGTRCVDIEFSKKIALWQGRNWTEMSDFYPGEIQFADNVFTHRVHRVFGLKPENGGKYTVSKLPVGHDMYQMACSSERGQYDRAFSLFVFLNTEPEMGKLVFSGQGINVNIKQGRAVVISHLSPTGACEQKSWYYANMVTKGHRLMMHRFYYYRNFSKMNTRIPPPPVPERNYNQPWVQCGDEHKCTLGHEWTYSHITHQKYIPIS